MNEPLNSPNQPEAVDPLDGLKPTPLPKILRDFAAQFEGLAKIVETIEVDGKMTGSQEQIADVQNAILSIRRARHVMHTTVMALAVQTTGVAVKRVMAIELAMALRALPDGNEGTLAAAKALEDLAAEIPEPKAAL
jgi:hypothetical protein